MYQEIQEIDLERELKIGIFFFTFYLNKFNLKVSLLSIKTNVSPSNNNHNNKRRRHQLLVHIVEKWGYKF